MIYNIKNIHKALYGLDVERCIDVTKKLNNYFKIESILHTYVNINDIFTNPFPKAPKKLIIYETDGSIPHIIDVSDNTLNDNIIYVKKNQDLIINPDDANEFKKQLLFASTNNKYDLYVISSTIDQKQRVANMMQNQDVFNIHFLEVEFSVPTNANTSIHDLIKYAKSCELPYIIIAQDTFKFIEKIESVAEIIDWLMHNKMEWDVFNGSPYIDASKKNSLKKYKSSCNNKLFFTNWGLGSIFTIFNNTAYDSICKYESDENSEQIDFYISKKFIQIYPTEYITSHVDSLSINKSLKESQKMLITTPAIDTLPTIGIYSIFIDAYTFFYENFINNMEDKFLPQYKKFYYVVTDTNLPLLNDRTHFFHTKFIAWPYSTLYRYKYFLKFPSNEIAKSSIIYFINANALCTQTITTNIFPYSDGHVFTQHNQFVNRQYSSLAFDRNIKSTACIPHIPNHKYVYYGGGFFGATTKKFLELCEKLDKNIEIDEAKKYIARWHDESHLNHYCNVILKHNFNQLDSSYHLPYFKKWRHGTNIAYLHKEKFIPSMSKIKHRVTYGKVIPNDYNKHIIGQE